MKKVVELNANFGPLLLVFPLLFILGRTYAVSTVLYVFSFLFCMLFNMFKVHRALIEYPCGRLTVELLFPLTLLAALVVILIKTPSSMLYLIKN